jgi:hypothetical protein
MSKVEVTGTVPFPLDQVWDLVSDFTGFIERQGIPLTSSGQGIGMTRTLDVFGASITERFESLDEANHVTSYSIVESPLPIRDYQAWIALTAAGDHSTDIAWWSEFEPTNGDEDGVAALVRGIYEGGIAAIEKVLSQ